MLKFNVFKHFFIDFSLNFAQLSNYYKILYRLEKSEIYIINTLNIHNKYTFIFFKIILNLFAKKLDIFFIVCYYSIVNIMQV